MRKIIVCMLCILMIGVFTACAASPVDTVQPQQNETVMQVGDTFGRFIVMDVMEIGDQVYQYTMYDAETYAMYSYTHRGYQNSTMVPLYNTDGSIMINMELAAVG